MSRAEVASTSSTTPAGHLTRSRRLVAALGSAAICAAVLMPVAAVGDAGVAPGASVAIMCPLSVRTVQTTARCHGPLT